jgi:hypothetical protein
VSTSFFVRAFLLGLMLWGSLSAVDHGVNPILCALAYWGMTHAIDRAWDASEVTAKERSAHRRRRRA